MSSSTLFSKLLIIPPIAIGAAVLWYAVTFRDPPKQQPVRETATRVRVLTLAPQSVMPSLTGYGIVKPENVWTGVTQVAGRVEYVNPEFRRGATLPEGTELIRIAQADYHLAVSEAEAQIRSAEAKLAELELSRQNTEELLRIEEQSLTLKQRSVDAKRALLQRGNIAQLSFDAELRDMLTQKKQVQDLRNTLRLIPTQISVQQEQIRVNRSKLETAKLNLKRTSVRLPFTARIAAVNAELSQFLQIGAQIGVADGIATAEITAQYPLDHIRAFFDALRNEFKPGHRTWASRQEFAKAIGLYAVVELKSGDTDATWRGRVARLNDTLDEKTRTVGLIVLVDNPYTSAKPGVRPPLVKGMFVEVTLRAQPLKDKIVIPAAALHAGRTYVVGAENRLEIRKPQLGYRGSGFVVVTSGLKTGDRLVVTDISHAVPRMLLEPVEDEALKAELERLAAAREAVR